jgi:hypothetical protein
MRALSSVLFLLAVTGTAAAGPFLDTGRPVFTQTLNNLWPLEFAMSAAEAELALGAPLNYVQGRPGDEMFWVIRTHGGSGFFPRADRLFLQFRRGRLTGLKGDWGSNWMWRSP